MNTETSLLIIILLILVYIYYFKCYNVLNIENFLGEYRDENTCGMDRMSKDKKWYHEANRLVKHDEQLYTKNKRKNMKSKRNEKRKKSIVKCGDKKKKLKNLVFNDFYEGGDFNELMEESNGIKLEKKDRTNYSTIDDKNKMISCNDGKICDNTNNDDIKLFLQEKVLNGQDDCFDIDDKNKAKYTRDEVDNYREQQIQFRNKILHSSAPVGDPVDKQNQIRLQGGFLGNNETIADVYDSMVNNGSTKDGKSNVINFVNHVDDRETLGRMMMTGLGNDQIRSNYNHNDWNNRLNEGSKNCNFRDSLTDKGITNIYTQNNKPFRLNL